MSYGYLMIAGRKVPVIDVAFRAGKLWITAEVNGPFPRCDEATATLFGEDGQGVMQNDLYVSIPEVKHRRDKLVFTWELKPNEVRSE